jgi:hypothetical protein
MYKVTTLLFLVSLLLSACNSSLPTDGATISWSQAIDVARRPCNRSYAITQSNRLFEPDKRR